MEVGPAAVWGNLPGRGAAWAEQGNSEGSVGFVGSQELPEAKLPLLLDQSLDLQGSEAASVLGHSGLGGSFEC